MVDDFEVGEIENLKTLFSYLTTKIEIFKIHEIFFIPIPYFMKQIFVD